MYYTGTDTNNLLNHNISTSGGPILGDLKTWAFRCLGFTLINNDDDNCLRLIQPQPNESISNTATTETTAYMCFQLKGASYIRLSTTEGVQMYKDLTVGVNASTSNIRTYATHYGNTNV